MPTQDNITEYSKDTQDNVTNIYNICTHKNNCIYKATYCVQKSVE